MAEEGPATVQPVEEDVSVALPDEEEDEVGVALPPEELERLICEEAKRIADEKEREHNIQDAIDEERKLVHDEDKKKTNWTLWIIIGVVVLGGLMVGLYFLFSGRKAAGT